MQQVLVQMYGSTAHGGGSLNPETPEEPREVPEVCGGELKTQLELNIISILFSWSL